MNSPATLSDELFAQLQGAPIQQISQQLGTDAAQTREAVGAALPMLLGSLGQNASQPQGAEALFGALQRDHAGGGADLGGLLGSLLGGGASAGQADGAGILGHIFGGNQQRAEDTLGQATGLGGNNAANLLKMLAPSSWPSWRSACRAAAWTPAGSAPPWARNATPRASKAAWAAACWARCSTRTATARSA